MVMKAQEKLGENIRKVRTSVDWTQQQVADRAGMHVNYYARVERGEENPSFETLEKIMKALKIKSKEVMPF